MTNLQYFLLCTSAFFSLPSPSNADDLPVIIQSLNKDVMIVSTADGFSPQLVIAAQKGISVFSTLGNEDMTAVYRSAVQKALNRKDFLYLINGRSRLDLVVGNVVYPEAEVVSTEITYNELQVAGENAAEHLQDLQKMWHQKAEQAKNRLNKSFPGSERAAKDSSWQIFCERIADDLKNPYQLRLPSIIFSDSLTLDLGDKKLELFSFGRASFTGGLLAYVPEEQLIYTGFLFSEQHLIPTPNKARATLDIPRWLYVLDKLLNDEKKISYVICSDDRIKTKQWLIERQRYISDLWRDINILNTRDLDLEDIQTYLSVEKKYAYLKNWDTWQIRGPDQVIKEHRRNVQVFWEQLQNFASDQIESTIADKGIHAAIRQYYELIKDPEKKYYFNEQSFNTLGYKLLNHDQYLEAITIFKLNAEAYPRSANVYDSLGEAYMKSGNTDLSIQYYRKSLFYDPDNINAREMLNKLENN